MCWLCDNPDKTVDDYLDLLREKIRRRGWAVQYVEDETVPFAYTIGLHARGAPEFLVTGVEPFDAWRLLNWSAGHSALGTRLAPGQQFVDPGGRLLEVVHVDHPDAHLTFAVALGGPHLRAQQLVWADESARWPWEAGWARGRRRQPVLGMRAAAA